MRTFYLSAFLPLVLQIQTVFSSGCNISSVTSPSASTLRVEWSSYSDASVYLLDLRVVNSTSIAPVMVMQTAPTTQRLIQGLRPGHVYQVKLKVLQYYTVLCMDTEITMTVPATSQITFSKAISSTSIQFEWSSVIGADSYMLFVEKLFGSPPETFSQNFTTLSGQVDGLTPSTTYNCYIISSNSAGRGAKSTTKTIMTLVQPPTGVTVTKTGKSTARVTWNPVSKVLLYQVKVSDVDPSNAPVIRNTSSTSMDISNLEPCSTYIVGVSSANVFLVPGEPSNVSYTTSTINPVTTISVEYSCSNSRVIVTWDLVFGANMYRATAVDGTGESRNCTSPSNSCHINLLKCGEKYVVHVTAISDDCESTSNTSNLFETVPCAPANPRTIHECSSNVIIFTWEPTNNTFFYVAKSVDSNGKETPCRTADHTCFFTNTGCGQNYTYTVYAVSSECNSEETLPEYVQTSPCLPTNIKTAPGCNPNMLITTWEPALGATSYLVEAQGNTAATYNCTSNSSSCAVPGVPCGEHLSVFIIASNDRCSTGRVLGEVAQTVPCAPTNIGASVDCSQDSARVNWVTNIGAIFYIATAQDAFGNSRSCNSMGTNCLIGGLHCGRNYTGSVIGTNLKCNSTVSEEITFMTGPCPPSNVMANRDCDLNNAMIVWQNHQPSNNYTATIQDQNGDQLNCTSKTLNNCKINNLPCGRRYSVNVTSYDGTCPSTSAPISMDSVPCGPENVTASVDCQTGELTVAWNISVPADNYTAIISRGMGQTMLCNSSTTQCTRGGLSCGSSYMVTVFSVTGTCFSLPSSEVTVQTLPCPPTNISAVHTCAPNSVPVSWVASASAKRYIVVAVSSKGHRSECKTNTTSCSVPKLMCGEVYTIGVSGVDDNCTGHLSDTITLKTEPCSPINVSSQLMCREGSSQVFWAPSANAVNYTVKAISDGHILTCSGPSPNCTLSNFTCGQAYDIIVKATDGICISNYSAPFRQDPVPCAPENITTNLICGTPDLMVNWSTTAVPLNYSVIAKPLVRNISSVACHTSGGNCTLRRLECGSAYNVSIKACSGSCCGPYSLPETVQTASCPPQNLTAVTNCGTDSLLVSWKASQGSTSYFTKVTGPNGFSRNCSSPNLTCSVSGLKCASQYHITLTSQDSECTGSSSETVLMTGPCDPVNVTTVLQCGSTMAAVSWTAAPGAVAYTVLAKDQSSQNYTSCRSNTTSCQLKRLQCGRIYNVTVLAEDDTCNSTGSIGTTMMTAPCSSTVKNSTLICGTNSSSLSWMPMANAIGYVVHATSTSGHEVNCSSATANCTLMHLMCSETYMTTITTRGRQCNSAPGPSINITTAPCPPTITSKQYSCDTKKAVFSWTRPMGHIRFKAKVAGKELQIVHPTMNTSYEIHNLPCGMDLYLTVQAEGAQCSSPPSVSEMLETVPCAPENVSATLVCSNHSALVSWVGSLSAIGYNVTATGQDGRMHQYQTHATSYQIPNIRCGETYNITVTPYSKTCAGNPSASYVLKTGLCPPSNVTVSPSCHDSTVSWSHVPEADMVIATATAEDGHTHTCKSNHSNSCDFTDLHCGEMYNVTVVTVDRGCKSESSSAVELKAALCPPTNLTTQVSCGTNTLVVTWDQSPTSWTTYKLKYELIGGSLPATEHITPNTSHTLTNLQCGQRYAFYIATQEGHCSSKYSPPVEISTAPCQPTNFSARVDCGTNRGNFSWVATAEAGSYIVEVTGQHGHVASCSSNGTSCSVKLHCGRSYSASLVASTESCNSTKHADIHFESAPCLPDDVSADLDCNTNVMNVTWSRTKGSDDYTAWAISPDGHRAYCNSTFDYCLIHGLKCGKVYEVAVTSSSINCEVIAGSDYKIQSAPCKPENTTVSQNCSSNVVTVKWKQGGTTQNYTVKAVSDSGVSSTCDSMENGCSFLNLSCGQQYTFTVMGHTNVCMSEMSTPIERLTAPCPPSNVSAQLNCTTRKATVTWSRAAAASAYSVQAVSASGHNSTCSDMGTSCVLTDLRCGQEYSVVVEAMHTGCPGPASSPVWLTTEPCTPMNLSVHYKVSSAQVMWAAARGAISYSVKAVSDQGLMVPPKTTTGTSSYLNGLQCGQIYNVTVMARNQACDSIISETHSVTTEPCPPTNVQASMTCEQLSATVSWKKSKHAVGYVAYFDSGNGHSTSCFGTASDYQCEVSGLVCGTVYNVRVKALGWQYNSSDSSVVSFTSGPCKTNNIQARMDCEARFVTMSWLPSIGTKYYIGELTDSSGYTVNCTTNYTHCDVHSLQCGEEYNVTVKAMGDTCNNTAQMAGYLITEPCAPMNLSVHYNVSSAKVMWAAARGATSYSVKAVTDQGLMATCTPDNNTNSNTSCYLNGLQCGQIYNVTVMARNHACNNTISSESVPLMTEPCPPTNVQANMACEQLSATVTWQRSDLAVGYVAYFDSGNGHHTLCDARDPSTVCVASGLECGTVYNVWMKALGRMYNSSASAMFLLTSAPCLPREVEVEVNCNSDGAAVVSWNATHGPANFSLTAIVSGSLQTLCETPHNRCNVTGLSCGETYNLSLTVSNSQCSLTVPIHSNLTTRPCPPQRVGVDLQCGSNTAVLSWEERSDVELYEGSAVKASGGAMKKCNRVNNTCQFSNLECGEMYNITVRAQSQSCWSQDSETVFIQTEPCQPVIMSAQASCQNEDVQISWHHASGVVNYLVTATGSLGYVESHNTSQTLLSAALPCGQNYTITVQGQGSRCDSIPSSPAFVKTGPCIPRDLTTYVQCEFNMSSVSWGPSDGAKSYEAVATGLDGHTHVCPSNDTSCTWNDLHCGEVYTVVVRAKGHNCTSLPSNSTVIHMAPCATAGLVPSVDCDTKVVSLRWNGNNRTKSYMVSAEGGNNPVRFTTNDTVAHFSELTCGQSYSLTVTPHSQHCPGSSSGPAFVQTWPCPPAGVSAMQDCLSGVVMVKWKPGNGSEHFTATMQMDTGVSKMCMSNDSNECSVSGLTCGQNFSVSVTASNQQCNVTSSQSTILQSVPCVPTDVSVLMDCNANSAVVSWSPSRGAVNYSVTIFSRHSNNSYMTSNLRFSLDNLACGSSYTAEVVALADNCSSAPSQTVMFNSASCPPENVSAEVSCSSNTMNISWDTMREADHYLVSVVADNGGKKEICNTTDTTCSVSNVTCGTTFRVHVSSIRDTCRSRHSQIHSIKSAPCQPKGIRGKLDCVTNSAWISWDHAPGADSYFVSAVGGEYYKANCTATSNTTCEVEDLECGVSYNFSVTAKNSKCESQPSATIDLETAPCSLASITAVPQCHNSSILVMWERMEGSEGNTMYTATAEGRDHTYLYCNDTGTYCYLHGAQCDLHYTIIVSASSDQCSSMRSPPYRISMEPCPPRNLVVNSSCEENSALVSWSPSPVAENYQAVAKSVNGHVRTCNSSFTNCTLTKLYCDQQYTVTVTSFHENCSSKASQSETFNTGPCEPDGLSVSLHCNNQSAWLSWNPRDNAVDYYGYAKAENGDMLYCHGSPHACVIHNIECGTVYNFSVQASDGTCNSSFSTPVQSGAAPCPPDNIEVKLYPAQMEIQVMFFEWTRITCNNTEYQIQLTGTLLGDNQAQFEISSYWTRVTFFEFPLPCGSEYVATVKSRNNGGISDSSVPLTGTTAPCPPTGVMYSGSTPSATVSWNPSVFATRYMLFGASVTPNLLICNTTGLSCALSNMPNVNLVIIASNAAGESEARSVPNGGTNGRRRRDLDEKMQDNGHLSAPLVHVTHVTSSIFFIEWPPVEAAAYYSLLIKKQGFSSESQELTVYGERILVDDLSPNSAYCFTLSAQNSEISGPESTPVCVRTGQGVLL